MLWRRLALVALTACFLTGCPEDPPANNLDTTEGDATDTGGTPDTGTTDTGTDDTGTTDTGTTDTGTTDTGTTDTGTTDTGTTDTGTTDTGTDSTDTADPPVVDGCVNATDGPILQANDAQAATTMCATTCLLTGATDLAECTTTCLAGSAAPGLGLTTDCASCFADVAACTLTNCSAECAPPNGDPASAACLTCIGTNGCTDNFYTCTGLPEPPVVDACTNAADTTIIDGNDVDAATAMCAASCVGSSTDLAECTTTCLAGSAAPGLGLSTDCASCYSDVAACTATNCSADCAPPNGDPASDACQTCIGTNGCADNFLTCSGLPECDADYAGAPSSPEGDTTAFGGVGLVHAMRTAPRDQQNPPWDSMSIELYYGFGASDQVGDYQPYVFPGENYFDCDKCALAFKDCTADGAGDVTCAKTFVIQSGELDLTSLGRGGDQFTGTLRNAVFAEATIASDFRSTLVPNGETWCVAEHTFDVRISPYCGDGIIDGGEDCDDGANNSDTNPDSCRADCSAARCGDGVIDTGEACDDGANNGVPPSTCSVNCVDTANCGNGTVDIGEECDNGANNSDTDPDACRSDCRNPSCGDSVTDTGEACDEGANNGQTFFHCSTNCNPCTYDDVPNTIGNEDAELLTSASFGDFLAWRSQDGAPQSYNFAVAELYYDFGASEQPSAYAPHLVAANTNYNNCSVCLLAFRDCTSSSCIEGNYYLARENTELTLTSLGRAGDTMTGTMTGVFELVSDLNSGTIVDADNNSEADETWCIDVPIGPTTIQ